MTDRPRRAVQERPSPWALLTVLPDVLLGLGELIALTNRTVSDTLSEVTWWALGEPGSLRHHLVAAWVIVWLWDCTGSSTATTGVPRSSPS